jgi:membrane fusion protein (multidrug efflux system)
MVSPKRQVTVALVIFAILFIVLAGYKTMQILNGIAEGKKHGPPPAAVTTLVVHKENWPVTVEVTGSLNASQGVTLSAENKGKISKIHFESGQQVQQGTVLVELDSSVEEANYKGAQSLADEAWLNKNRAEALKERGVISQAELDAARAKATQLNSAAESFKASLQHMKIIAPFSGKTGIRVVSLGQYVEQGTPVVPLFNEEVLYLNFSVPQKVLASVSPGKKVTFSTDGYPLKTFEGIVTSVNPNINEETRNADVQATVQNTEKLLHPGMFAHLSVDTGEVIAVVPVPASSISYAPYGDTLYIVDKQNKDGAEVSFGKSVVVRIGPKIGDQVGIISGLNGEEEVVTSGMFKIIPNVPLIINNSVAPSNEKKPNAENT